MVQRVHTFLFESPKQTQCFCLNAEGEQDVESSSCLGLLYELLMYVCVLWDFLHSTIYMGNMICSPRSMLFI